MGFGSGAAWPGAVGIDAGRFQLCEQRDGVNNNIHKLTFLYGFIIGDAAPFFGGAEICREALLHPTEMKENGNQLEEQNKENANHCATP